MAPENGPVHVEYSITRNVLASATEVELGELFDNCQKTSSTRIALSDMSHQQPPTPAETDNTLADSKVNGTKQILSNRHDILLGQRQNTTKPFPHILGRGKEKPSGLCHKTPPNMVP